GDRLEEPRAFARAVGVRLVGAGLGSVVSSLVPGRRAAPHSPVARRLEALRADARGVPMGVDSDIDQEQTLLTVLGVSIWAAVLPWLAGGEPIFAGALSLIALGFPAAFLFTRRTGKASRRKATQ
ncbi:MAG TPA: RimK family alpha-L-glutamate ligase, partial [Sphingopyxis sp.]|nr:RimK family alpha-L-glutamate ligase [Sphingopyxis sp.]